jgi:hypothetical protein
MNKANIKKRALLCMEMDVNDVGTIDDAQYKRQVYTGVFTALSCVFFIWRLGPYLL